MILVTIARDAEPYLERFVKQVDTLRPRKVIVAEGDSVDCTYQYLRETPFTVLKVETGGPHWPSVISAERFRQLGVVAEVALTAAVRELQSDESVLYVESDLEWDAETIERLMKHTTTYPAVAPMVMYHGRFFDEWAYRMHGQHFRRRPPYFDGWSPDMMHKIDSAGSCIAMSYTAALVAHFSPVDCIVGVGRTIKEAGLSLWLDPTLEVNHP